MPTPASAPTAPLVPCSAGWQQIQSQNVSWNSTLGGIASVSANDMWAVGFSYAASAKTQFGNGDRNLTEHWDGSFWSVVPIPQPGPDGNDLTDVAAITGNDVWAIGIYNTTGFVQGAAYHWTGTAWSANQVPGMGNGFILNDIAAVASNDVWAVGRIFNNAGIRQTLTMHWNGAAWSVVASPSVGSGDNALDGVTAISATEAWAVGYSKATPTSPRQALIEHWIAGAWTVVASPAYSGPLFSVAADSASSAWAVGYTTGSNSLPLGVAARWNGTTWTDAGFSEPSVFYEVVEDIVAVSSTNYWAVGFSGGNGATPGPDQPFAMQWTGAAWQISGQNGVAGITPVTSNHNDIYAVTAPASGGIVWALGGYLTPSNLEQTLIYSYNAVGAPTSVFAAVGDQSAPVSWTAPACDGGSAVTSYMVFAYDGCTTQSWVTATGGTSVTFTGLTNGTAYTFRVAAVNAYGMGPLSAASNAVTLGGATPPSWVTACSRQQYQFTASDGGTWKDVDPVNLKVTFTPAADGYAVLSGNADLWTDTAGYNQDLGVAVTGTGFPTTAGQPEAWKESGGFAGTYSPNAAYVQSVISVTGGVAYTAKLQWKANRPDPGTIWAGAGPLRVYPGDCLCPVPPPGYSPTRLTVILVSKASGTVFYKTSSNQYTLSGNNGGTWMDMDATNLTQTFTPPAGNWTAYISGNADLWTQQAGYNQNIGVTLSGVGFPTTAGQPEAWKESGGFAGTFSPNAAFVQAAVPVTGLVPYTAKLQWKTNRPDPGTIYAGAGPIGTKFSPTALTVILVPASTGAAVMSTTQYVQSNSDGGYWQPIDSTLKFTLAPSAATSFQLTANADLWTATAGYNQDVGIMVSGGGFGAGTLVAWKESGGFAGTYSPNAAFVTAMVHLQPSTTYTVWAVWKANKIAAAANQIYIGAGPIATKYSPTWLTGMQVSQP